MKKVRHEADRSHYKNDKPSPDSSAARKIGIKGLTISEVKGFGEEVRLNNPDSIHDRIDILVSDERDEVLKIILDHAATGLAGDGLVAVSSVDYVFKIRNRERMR